MDLCLLPPFLFTIYSNCKKLNDYEKKTSILRWQTRAYDLQKTLPVLSGNITQIHFVTNSLSRFFFPI